MSATLPLTKGQARSVASLDSDFPEESGSDFDFKPYIPRGKGGSMGDPNPPVASEKQADERPAAKGRGKILIPDSEPSGEPRTAGIMHSRMSLREMYGRTVAERGESPSVREQIAGRLVEQMGCPGEVARDLATLTLYDVAILINDSGSMVYKENGARKEALIQFIDLITEIYSIANEAGILAMRFMNCGGGKSNWIGRSRYYLGNHKYGGGRRIGTELKEKILDEFVIGNSNQRKPLLVLIVTDGTVVGEKKGHLKNVIQDCVNECEGSGKGFDAVTFQFTRIGKDPGAAQLLIDLDEDPDIREYIDVLPVEFGLESLSEEKWFVLPKILLGAILSDWGKQK